MTFSEPEPKRRFTKPAWTEKALAVWRWLQNRRTANTIAKHGQAITALVATAGAGIGAFGVVEARQAQHDVNALQAQVTALQVDTALVSAALANLRTDVRALDRKNAKALTTLKHDLTAAAIEMDNLGARIAAIPPAPSVAPLAARISRLAATTRETARLAAAATSAAAEQHDPEARAAAALAADAAGLAAEAARAAQKKADEAKEKADSIVIPPPATIPPIPPFEFPRTIAIPNDTRAVNGAPYQKVFTVDLPRGRYYIETDATVEAAAGQHWVGTITAAPARFVATGPGQLEHEFFFDAPGGTASFTFYFDADVVGAGFVTVKDIVVTINQEAS
jgi:hypothetical protein